MSGLSSSTSANANREYESAGLGERDSIIDLSSGVMVRHGVQAEDVNSARNNVLFALLERR